VTEPRAEELTELGRCFDEHRSRLLRALENRIDVSLRRRLDPEDVLADAFLKAQSRWARFCDERPISLYPWLHQQVLDSLFAAWRRHDGAGRDMHREMPWPEHSSAALALGLFGSVTTPSRALHRAELAEKVRLALQMLKPEDREILLLRHFDELSNVEAGEVLGINAEAAAKRYLRALGRLKTALEKLGVGPELIG
jgi:RNA polymerase sigma-70 factor (ECF subfamily)